MNASDNADLQRFAEDLRALLQKEGLSYRALAARAHYSRTALSAAASGRALPSLDVLLAFVRSCDGDRDRWEARWRALHRTLHGQTPSTAVAAPDWPAQPLIDGSEPESAGSAADGVTVHARRVALATRKHIIGQVELRYSARTHAAWARFEGFSNLDHLATHRHRVEVAVEVHRLADGAKITFREEYTFEFHWTNLLRTDGESFLALVTIFFDGNEVASGRTDAVALS